MGTSVLVWLAANAAMALWDRNAAADPGWAIELTKPAGKPVRPVAGHGFNLDGVNQVDATGTTVTVTCKDATKCTDVTAAQVTGASSVPLATQATATATSVVFLLDPKKLAKGTRLQLSLANAVVADAELTIAGDAKPVTSAATVPVKDLVATSCPISLATVDVAAYDAAADLARMVVTPVGNLLSASPQNIDENDAVQITVIADDRLLPLLHVVRKSAIREAGNLSIVGGDVNVPPELIVRHAAGAPPSCGKRTFTLRDFAPGKGEVEIRALVGADEVILGGLEFVVDRLYSGMFSLGAMWTHQIDPSFKLTPGAGGNTIAASEHGSGQVLYTLFYTPFVHGRRDIEKPQDWIAWDRVNPSVGLVLNDPLEHAIVGISYDLDYGIVFTAGLHVGHVHKLDGVMVGAAFGGTVDQISVDRTWETTYFVGVSIDLRAAVQMLKAALVTK
jgi:hypothetical protein